MQETKKIVIYFHGLGSKAASPKLDALNLALEGTDAKVIADNLPISPDDVSKYVFQVIYNAVSVGVTKIVLVGTSLGGFYASSFGELYDIPYVIANPATNPSKDFRRYVDNPPTSFATGEKIIFTEKHFSDFEVLEEKSKFPTSNLASVFLAKDDDVVDCEKALQLYKNCDNVILTDDGGHRYESNWNLVVDRVVELIRN